MPERVLKQIVEHFFEKPIRKNFPVGAGLINVDIEWGQQFKGIPDYR